MNTEPMSVNPSEDQSKSIPVSRKHGIVFGVCLIAIGGFVAACGEDEEAETAPTPSASVEATATSSSESSKTGASGKETASQKRKQERAKKREELAEKRRATAKASAEARKKAINEAAQAQSGRKPVSSVPSTGKNAAGSSADGTAGRRIVQRAAPPADITPLNIDRILTLPDVKQLTGIKRLTDLGPLVGIPQSEMYNSRYMAPAKRSTFGVSVQVWKETLMRDMNERFSRMRRDYPNVTDTNAVTPKGFFSYWNELMTLVFMDFQKKLLVAVSCSTEVCSPEKLYELAKRAKEQL